MNIEEDSKQSVIDILPPVKSRKGRKKAPVVDKSNRYYKYLEESTDENSPTRPQHYKNALNSFRSGKNSFLEDISESMASIACYEGGGRSNKEQFTKSQLAAGDKVKKLFNNEDVLG